MAAKNTSNKNAKPNGAADASALPAANATAAKPKKDRAERSPDLVWDAARMTALAALVAANNGQLSPRQVVDQLKTHPAFIADAHLLTPEKIRARVNKLSARAEARGQAPISLRRAGNAGYDIDDILNQVLGPAVRGAVGAGAGVEDEGDLDSDEGAENGGEVAQGTVHVQAQTPMPITSSGLFPGGLIPT